MAFLRNSVTLKRTRENLASAVVAVGVALIPALSAADEYTPALRDVLRQAKEEGSVRIFLGSGRYPQSAADALSAAFEEKFGFPLETEFASLGAHPPTVNKLAAEARLGIEPPADLFRPPNACSKSCARRVPSSRQTGQRWACRNHASRNVVTPSMCGRIRER